MSDSLAAATPHASQPLDIIAHIQTDFVCKFGIPRQSGLVPQTEGRIVFTPPYRNPDALRGLEGFSHLWLIWQFSQALRSDWSPTVRPPRLGGDARVGVFASRSPFRPNALGLSSVRLLRVRPETPDGPVIEVAGADLLNQTPIFDIKPYLAYTDSHPEASGGFASACADPPLRVDFPAQWLVLVPEHQRDALIAVLAQDPRPRYQQDPERVYAFEFGACHIRFRVDQDRLQVCHVSPWHPAGLPDPGPDGLE